MKNRKISAGRWRFWACLGIVLSGCGQTRSTADTTGAGGGAATPPPNSVPGGLCPSLGLAADSLLLASVSDRKLALIRADGAVYTTHTLPFSYPIFSVLRMNDSLVVAAVAGSVAQDAGERAWHLARFDANGGLIAASNGAFPLSSDPFDRIYPPLIRKEQDAVAFDLTNGDTWVVDPSGTAELRECEQRTLVGQAEELGWTAGLVELERESEQAVFVDTASGACRRTASLGSTGAEIAFHHGRFQYIRTDSVAVLSDEGPSSSVSFALSAPEPDAAYRLYSVSEDLLYVLAPSYLARYDVVSKELSEIELPAETAALGVYGDWIVGTAAGLPLWGYDLVAEQLVDYELAAPAGSPFSRIKGDFALILSDERPTTWLALTTGEARPFEVSVPAAAALETMDEGQGALLVADGVPVSHLDFARGVATALELPRYAVSTETFRDGSAAFVVQDGVPTLRIEIESGTVSEILNASSVLGAASTRRVGAHVLVSSDGHPQALLDMATAELVSVSGGDEVPATATAFVASERYLVGFDDRAWPVFRLDLESRAVAAYRVSEPSDLVSFRDPRYIETPGDTLYDQYYAPSPSDANASVFDDGSVGVALRDDRQGRLWLVAPDDLAFRPIGRPVTDVLRLDWSAADYYFQLAGRGGDCYCVPPVMRWEPGADADALTEGSVEFVSRAHPSMSIVKSDYSLIRDASGVCIVEDAAPARLVHDLLAGTSVELDVDGALRFVTE